MRPIRTLGLAAAAALAAMAFVGTSSAMAENTALCTAHAAPCPAGNIYTGHFEGLAENPELLNNLVNVKCEHSVILGNALGLATPQVTHLESISFTGDCLTKNGMSCTITTEKLGLLLLLRTGLNAGELEVHDTKVKFKCGLALNCNFGGLPVMEAEGSVGGGLGAFGGENIVLTKTGGTLCPTTTTLDAIYKIQLPDPVYITT